MQDLPRDSGDYLSALRNLHSLALFNITVQHISEVGFHTCFSAFRETLTSLSLDSFVTSFGAFVTLVDYFPNITTLQLCSFELEPDEIPVPSQSRPLRGKLRVHVQIDCQEFLDQFSKLNLEYEELVIDTPSATFTGTKFVEIVPQISPNTVKFLRLTAQIHCE